MEHDRRLSLFDLTCLGVNAIVGSGIFLLPGRLAALLGPASVLSFACCGLISLLIALCFAEVAGRFDRSGGPYVYASSAFGGQVGYLVGWTCWTAAMISWAAVTRGLVLQLGHFNSALSAGIWAQVIGVGLVAALAAINIAGVRPGSMTTNVLTIAKLVPLLLLLVVGWVGIDWHRLTPFAPRGFEGLSDATFIAFFAYQGFEVVPVPAGESANPRRNAPLAVVGSVLMATALYMLLQLAAIGTTPQLAGAEQPLALMAEALIGPIGGQLIAVAAVISMLGFSAGVAFAGPRYVEALAEDDYLPPLIAARHPRRGTPHVAIVLTSCVTAALVVVLDFMRLISLAVAFVAVQYLSTCLAVPVLRRRGRASPSAFRMPGGTSMAVTVSVVVALFVGRSLLAEANGLALATTFAGLLALGVVAAGTWRLVNRG